MRTIKYVSVGDCLSMSEGLKKERKTILLTDRNVYTCYSNLFAGRQVIVMEAGESAKTFDTYLRICEQLFDLGADRATLLVGVGGGVVSDMTGFVGATFMRGIAFGFVATTLLSQIDASIGGKNGVDMSGYKNIIGTFSEPEFVLCDPLFFATLPKRELAAGYAEAVKYALLTDLSVVDDEQMVARCVEIKMEIVSEDFRDSGRRKFLNLGHTFAHAIEKCSDRYNHGEAVAIGLSIMARVSHNLGYLTPDEVVTIDSLLERFDLPTRCDEIDRAQLLEAAMLDKKRVGDSIEMVLLSGLGQPIVERFRFDALADAYNA